jgi:FlaA1/EpsC-like NDP-sugar epimerase
MVGFVDSAPRIRRADLPDHISILGGSDLLPEIVEQLQVERVIVAFSNGSVAELLTLLRELRPLGVEIDLVP